MDSVFRFISEALFRGYANGKPRLLEWRLLTIGAVILNFGLIYFHLPPAHAGGTDTDLPPAHAGGTDYLCSTQELVPDSPKSLPTHRVAAAAPADLNQPSLLEFNLRRKIHFRNQKMTHCLQPEETHGRISPKNLINRPTSKSEQNGTCTMASSKRSLPK